MILKEWLNYIENYIILKGEALEPLSNQEDQEIIHLNVIKRTVRTRRIVAKLTIGIQETKVPPEELIQTFQSPNVKRQFSDASKAYEWVRSGWVIREYRLKKDERTIDREQYRMGYALFIYQEKLVKKAEAGRIAMLRTWLNRWEETNQIKKTNDQQREDILTSLKALLTNIAGDVKAVIDQNQSQIKSIQIAWRFNKQIIYLHFLLALYQIARTEMHFDWKEIGARYYQYIGGSKKFDGYKSDFIEQTENLLERPLLLIGLTSLGTITPIYFTGEMRGKRVTYQSGAMHATTDLSVFSDKFETSADVLWLVENRGILTRMAYEKEFLKSSNSFILAIDGQLRSSHRQLIEYLLADVKQVIIWTDVDEAGLIIGNDVAKIVLPRRVMVKWVVPPLEVVTDQMDFEAEYTAAIKLKKEEQEQAIGGVEHWQKWINH